MRVRARVCVCVCVCVCVFLPYKLSAVPLLTLTHVLLGLIKQWPCLQTVCGALGGSWREVAERKVTRRAICLIIN